MAAEIFRLFGEIGINGVAEAKQDVDDVTDHAGEAGSRLASGLGKMALSIAKIGAVAIGTVATGIGVLTKNAVEGYAEYEQLVGGVETLFKGSSKKVMQYANNAYKASGLSANKYMETVTGFSASLLQSLGGDTEQAADIANMAIEDMSDNANKMGTAMESIQNAYQGFAKQNYTMLDNLKLGYGGTKEEMLRLLADAERLKAAQGELVEYSIDSYADIVEAIHTVQVEMGIYGTTSQEAATTIQGSMNTMKAAWSNFLVGMSDESQDFDTLLNNLIDSVVTFGDNLIPRLVETAPRLTKGLTQLAKNVAPYIPKVLKELLPALLSGAKNILGAVIEDLPSILEDMFGSTGRKVGEMISKIFKDVVPVITKLANDILPVFVKGIEFVCDNFTKLISIIGLVVGAFETLEIINVVKTAVSGATSAFGALSAVMAANPIGMVVTAVAGLAVGVAALTSLLRDNTEKVNENVEAARREADQARESRKAYDELRAAAQDKAAADLANISNTERLWEELQLLTDEQGNVKKSDEERASFIIGQLSEALGVEIELIDGQIQGYEELQQAVANAIEMKKAEIFLAANEEAYTEAVKKNTEQRKDCVKKEQEYRDAQAKRNQMALELEISSQIARTSQLTALTDDRIQAMQEELEAQNVVTANLHSAWDESVTLYEEYCADIYSYESALVAYQNGNADEVINILDRKNQAMLKAADIAGEATEQQKQQFLEQAQQMTYEYQFLAEEYLKGAEGITEAMVQKAGEDAELAWAEYGKIGGAMSDSIINGALSGSDAINAAIIGLVTNGLNAGQGAASGYSASTGTTSYVPSQNTTQNASWYASYYGGRAHAKGGIVKKGEMAFLEGEGTEAVVPLEKNKEWIGKVAADMTNALQMEAPVMMQSGNNKELIDKMDELINVMKSQKIYLDSGTIVGELAPEFDEAMGDIYAGKERGQ